MSELAQPRGVEIRLSWFAFVVTLLPLLTIHTTYLVSAAQGHVAWCIPHLHSCTSISGTGRDGAAYFIFKGVMIPAMTLLAVFWSINHRWLQGLGYRYGNGVGWLGLLASLSLILYTVTLGHHGDGFHLMRRIGVIGYMGMTGIAQIIVGAALYRSRWPLLQRSGRRLLALTAATLATAMISVIWQSVPAWHYESVEHSFEWILVLLIILWGVGLSTVWYVAKLSVTMPRSLNLE